LIEQGVRQLTHSSTARSTYRTSLQDQTGRLSRVPKKKVFTKASYFSTKP